MKWAICIQGWIGLLLRVNKLRSQILVTHPGSFLFHQWSQQLLKELVWLHGAVGNKTQLIIILHYVQYVEEVQVEMIPKRQLYSCTCFSSNISKRKMYCCHTLKRSSLSSGCQQKTGHDLSGKYISSQVSLNISITFLSKNRHCFLTNESMLTKPVCNIVQNAGSQCTLYTSFKSRERNMSTRDDMIA